MVNPPSPPSSEPTAAAPSALHYAEVRQAIQPDRVRFEMDAFHIFTVSVDGQAHRDVRPVRAFPVSRKADYISFLNQQGQEVALVAHPHKLDKASRKALDQALNRMYYVPKILRIDSIEEMWGISRWKVQTDCGYASFEVTDQESIRKLPPARYIMQDVDANRFEIEDATKLDPQSQALLHSET